MLASRDDPNNATRLQLEDDLQSTAAKRSTDELVTIPVAFVSSNVEVGKEGFNRFSNETR